MAKLTPITEIVGYEITGLTSAELNILDTALSHLIDHPEIYRLAVMTHNPMVQTRNKEFDQAVHDLHNMVIRMRRGD